MDSVNVSVFKALQQWLTDGHSVWLVSVVKTFGSSPRQPGALLALRGDGVFQGSVSGGCIEDDLISKALSGALPTRQAELLIYGATAEEVQRFNLPCGGTLELVVEPVNDRQWVAEVLTAIDSQRLIKRQLNFLTLDSCCSDASSLDVPVSVTDQQATFVYGPRWRMLIIGAGQTSAYLANMAQTLDYQVTVCEPRQELFDSWTEIAGVELISMMPDDAVVAMQPDAHTAIVALTHDPKLDDMALLEALKSPAFYVGALGSKKNNDQRRQRLAMFDLSVSEIERLHGPVGLPIGSRTPPEIAIAILAELIALRKKGAFNNASLFPSAAAVESAEIHAS